MKHIKDVLKICAQVCSRLSISRMLLTDIYNLIYSVLTDSLQSRPETLTTRDETSSFKVCFCD